MRTFHFSASHHPSAPQCMSRLQRKTLLDSTMLDSSAPQSITLLGCIAILSGTYLPRLRSNPPHLTASSRLRITSEQSTSRLRISALHSASDLDSSTPRNTPNLDFIACHRTSRDHSATVHFGPLRASSSNRQFEHRHYQSLRCSDLRHRCVRRHIHALHRNSRYVLSRSY